MFNIKADTFIEKLQMQSHPEGGYFKEVYRNALLTNFELYEGKERNLATSIYFLLKSGQVSKFHQLKSDEIWYYHYGSPAYVYMIDIEKRLTVVTLGPNINQGEILQIVITAGTIFGASVINPNDFSLMGCMVNPGFDFRDFKLIPGSELEQIIPLRKDLIELFS